MKIKIKFLLVLAAAAALATGSLPARPVQFPLRLPNGNNYTGPFTVALDPNYNPQSPDAFALYGGYYIPGMATNGLGLLNLIPGGYTVNQSGWSSPLHFIVPSPDTNTQVSVINLLTNVPVYFAAQLAAYNTATATNIDGHATNQVIALIAAYAPAAAPTNWPLAAITNAGALASLNTVNSNLLSGQWNYSQIFGVPPFLTAVTSNNIASVNGSQVVGAVSQSANANIATNDFNGNPIATTYAHSLSGSDTGSIGMDVSGNGFVPSVRYIQGLFTNWLNARFNSVLTTNLQTSTAAGQYSTNDAYGNFIWVDPVTGSSNGVTPAGVHIYAPWRNTLTNSFVDMNRNDHQTLTNGGSVIWFNNASNLPSGGPWIGNVRVDVVNQSGANQLVFVNTNSAWKPLAGWVPNCVTNVPLGIVTAYFYVNNGAYSNFTLTATPW